MAMLLEGLGESGILALAMKPVNHSKGLSDRLCRASGPVWFPGIL